MTRRSLGSKLICMMSKSMNKFYVTTYINSLKDIYVVTVFRQLKSQEILTCNHIVGIIEKLEII